VNRALAETPSRLRLVVFRHGPAEARDPTRWPQDDRRPLTPKGRLQTRKAARGLARNVDAIDLLATSPATRARETAEILHAELPSGPAAELWEELTAGRPASGILERIGEVPRSRRTVVLVGHEPALSELIGLALVGDGVPLVRLTKAGAVLVEFPSSVRPGAGRLRWALTRKQLMSFRAPSSGR
jgi:phosphohistidine phosphatase